MKKAERHNYYKKALALYEAEEVDFLCHAVRMARTGVLPDVYPDEFQKQDMKLFPELAKKKPKVTYKDSVWFNYDDKKARIKILKACIRETSVKTSTRK